MIRIYFISDRRLTPELPPSSVIVDAIEAGVDMVQIREKDLPAREVMGLAREAVEASRGGAQVFVNSRFDIAAAAGAAGVHLPASGLLPGDVRGRAPRGMSIGVSTHSIGEAMEAEAQGADFITFGPVFETPSKAKYGPPVGLGALREVLKVVGLPVYALGGIHLDNVERVIAMPVGGIAVVSAIATAKDRKGAVEAFRAAARRVRGGGT